MEALGENVTGQPPPAVSTAQGWVHGLICRASYEKPYLYKHASHHPCAGLQLLHRMGTSAHAP